MPDQRFAFGPFVLDSRRGMLLKDGAPVTTVGTRGLALLEALLQAKGEVVTRSELMDAAWSNASIEESNLTVQIATLRKCLGALPDGDEWITTVPRIGYRFSSALRVDEEVTVASTAQAPLPALAPNPSIAVLPFNNMSSDPEQDYFAEGLSEDLITDLSKVQGLLVIARNSSFAYKGRQADTRSVAQELGVRYVIEGSVRRAAGRVRISAQLIDASDNSHLWADRFDRDIDDIFALQDEVVEKIVKALANVLPAARSVARRRPTNIQAYDLFIRGRVLAIQSPEGAKLARPLLEKAIEVDPNFAEAHAWLAISHHFGWKYWGEASDPHRAHARAAAERAVSLDPENADAHWILGYVRAYDGKLAEGVSEFETALRINPNHADAWALLADLRVFEGRAPEGIECGRRAFRLNPYPPGMYYWALGWAQYAAFKFEEAVETLRHDAARGTGSQRLLAASLAQLGRIDEARREAAQFLAAYPHFRGREWGSTQPFLHDADRQHFLEGYLKAGLPR